MYLIVGLGNPDKKYLNTFHNMGFMCVDKLAEKLGISFTKGECKSVTAHARINGEKVILAKPVTYMNLSGEVIKDFVKFFKINLEDILIIYDDLDTEKGKIKIRYKGSSGGHNGLKNIENHLKTKEYKRIKIGIGKDKTENTIDYVIGKISKKDYEIINSVNNKAEIIIQDYLNMTFDNFMNKYNGGE